MLTLTLRHVGPPPGASSQIPHYAPSVLRTTTPKDLAEEVGVSPSAVRHWLRRNATRTSAGPWQIDADTAQRAREHFASTEPSRARTRDVCLHADCERLSVARGLCRMHYLRWYRAGGTDDPASGSPADRGGAGLG